HYNDTRATVAQLVLNFSNVNDKAAPMSKPWAATCMLYQRVIHKRAAGHAPRGTVYHRNSFLPSNRLFATEPFRTIGDFAEDHAGVSTNGFATRLTRQANDFT